MCVFCVFVLNFFLTPLCLLQENRSLQQTMQALQNELDSLRADNIKLYEKIKFLQSYPSKVKLCVCVCVRLEKTGDVCAAVH